jgi:hypothetical protein
VCIAVKLSLIKVRSIQHTMQATLNSAGDAHRGGAFMIGRRSISVMIRQSNKKFLI